MLRLEHSDAIGRFLRLDDLSTLGVSTQTLAEEAIARGDWEQARGLVDYFYEEMRIMHGILTTWIRDILRYVVEHSGVDDAAARAASAGMARMLETYPIGQAGRERCREAIAAGDAIAALDWLDRMRLEFKNPHEMLVAWIQDLLTYVAATWGEEAVLDSILETHQSIWGDRYARWDQMTPHEKLALTVEGMRGGHFSGPRRRGDMTLLDAGGPAHDDHAAVRFRRRVARRRPRNGPAALSHRRARRQPGAAPVDLAEDRDSLVLRPLLHLDGVAAGAEARPAVAAVGSRHGPKRTVHLVHLQGRGRDPGVSLPTQRPGDAIVRAGSR
jgi:hypothetical protein